MTVFVELVEQRVFAALVRHHLFLVAGRYELAAALRKRLVDRGLVRGDRLEQRCTCAAQLGQKRVDENHFIAEDRGDQLGERIAERDAFTKPGRTGNVEKREELGDQRFGDGQRANHGA
jgi:hypothetical protein